MATCNENIIKNMASEVARNCSQMYGINVEVEFVVYLIELLLLNPKYGQLFTKTINRNNLEYFVNKCIDMLKRGETSLHTLKMQFIIIMNYDKPQVLIDKHLESIDTCLKSLFEEIMDAYPESDDEEGLKKLYRKISVYIILYSGLGNPALILNLKEGMAALESVMSLAELAVFAALPRGERIDQLEDLVEVVSGVRLFNRDCQKGGDMIPNLPFDLVDAGQACLASISHSLISVMQRVHALTSAIEGCVQINDETGNVFIDIPTDSDLTIEEYKQVFDLLVFNRQYEMFVRCLLCDVSWLKNTASEQVDRVKAALEELHAAVKYKSAVPVITVFPLFARLWRIWRAMQNIMFLVSTVNRLMAVLAGIQEHLKMPYATLDKMARGRNVLEIKEPSHTTLPVSLSVEERLSLGSLDNYVTSHTHFSAIEMKDRHVELLGFCAICAGVGALVPCNLAMGLVTHKGRRYGFCTPRMAARFSRDPPRYINEVLHHVRKNPHLIHLLGVRAEVEAVRDVYPLITKHYPKIKVTEREVQTATHPVESHIDIDYSWDLWEWKRRACKWATLVNCQTHSTQTHYSHLRSEIHCQTTEPRDKCLQTKKDQGINTSVCNQFLWGLRGHLGDQAHSMDLVPRHWGERLKPEPLSVCRWPCFGPQPEERSSSSADSEPPETPERDRGPSQAHYASSHHVQIDVQEGSEEEL